VSTRRTGRAEAGDYEIDAEHGTVREHGVIVGVYPGRQVPRWLPDAEQNSTVFADDGRLGLAELSTPVSERTSTGDRGKNEMLSRRSVCRR
jgi:hypothetical protein